MMKLKMKTILLILFSAVLLLIISCGKEKEEIPETKLELREDGLIYEKGSDTPYTGSERARIQGKIIEYDVVDGVKQGKFKLYYEDGTLEMEGQLENNNNVGKWKYYYPDGKLESEGFFVDNKPEGRWVWYYPSGKIKEEGSYTKGIRVGWWKQYDETGGVIEEKNFELGDSTDTKAENPLSRHMIPNDKK